MPDEMLAAGDSLGFMYIFDTATWCQAQEKGPDLEPLTFTVYIVVD